MFTLLVFSLTLMVPVVIGLVLIAGWAGNDWMRRLGVWLVGIPLAYFVMMMAVTLVRYVISIFVY